MSNLCRSQNCTGGLNLLDVNQIRITSSNEGTELAIVTVLWYYYNMVTHKEFSVYQWFMDGSYESVTRFVAVNDAFRVAVALSNSVGGRIGTTVRVIITDGGDCIVWEWMFGKGLVFPPPEEVTQ